jgi:two-component system, OmpR family, phosphate regulon response regulator OmpR
MVPRVLTVEDEPDLRLILQDNLEFEGYEVLSASTGEEGLDLALAKQPDLVLLDLLLPRMSGYEVCRRLRAERMTMPIIMLTARNTEMDRVTGLELGADDYVSKPFEPRELSLRIANILKRAKPAAASPAESLRFGPFVFHIGRAELRKGEDVIRLTDREREMLTVLAATPGETVPRLALAGNGGTVNERAVDVQVNRLRRKIERNPANPLFVQTVRGIGYRLVLS